MKIHSPTHVLAVPIGYWAIQVQEYASVRLNMHSDNFRINTVVRQHLTVGVFQDEVKRFTASRQEDCVHNTYIVSHFMWFVAPIPFGVVSTMKDPKSTWGKSFVVSRKVGKTMLGNKPRVRLPAIVESDDADPRWRRWARLVDVADLARMHELELLDRYFDFTNSRVPELTIIIASTQGEIRNQRVNHFTVNRSDIQFFLSDGAESIWIPEEFATTVLYLVKFGYRPRIENALHASSR